MAHSAGQRLKEARTARGWTQADLARRAGISRAEVSSIEGDRLVPSVATALALARALDTTVERLFGENDLERQVRWAWSPPSWPTRFWQAEVDRQLVCYPVEHDTVGLYSHHGVAHAPDHVPSGRHDPERTLVVATCDPAAHLLAEEYARQTGYRMLVLVRSTVAALQLLREGLVHVAGVHIATPQDTGANARMAEDRLGTRAVLVRVARWEEGIAVSRATKVRSIRQLVSTRVRWVGREPGAAARRCLEELLGPHRLPRTVARSHRAVAEAIRSGWATAGVCVRVCCEDAGLGFISVRDELYDLCFTEKTSGDQRVSALVRVIRSSSFRRRLGEVPGYDTSDAGEIYETARLQERGGRR